MCLLDFVNVRSRTLFTRKEFFLVALKVLKRGMIEKRSKNEEREKKEEGRWHCRNKEGEASRLLIKIYEWGSQISYAE